MLKGSEKEMGQLFSLLRARTGVDFALYKHSTLRRRIVRQMILHKLDSLGKYVSYLEKQPKEVDGLFNDLLIYVTSFFRDPPAFQGLKKVVFPKLLRAHPGDSPMRFWVCGCSTGEEAYSLAISLVEFLNRIALIAMCKFSLPTSATLGSTKPGRACIPRTSCRMFHLSACGDFSAKWTVITRSTKAFETWSCSRGKTLLLIRHFQTST
jgi:hypothetical protein